MSISISISIATAIAIYIYIQIHTYKEVQYGCMHVYAYLCIVLSHDEWLLATLPIGKQNFRGH